MKFSLFMLGYCVAASISTLETHNWLGLIISVVCVGINGLFFFMDWKIIRIKAIYRARQRYLLARLGRSVEHYCHAKRCPERAVHYCHLENCDAS